jgi:hypothetical protein
MRNATAAASGAAVQGVNNARALNNAILADDLFMPAQWAAAHHSSEWSGERRLMLAVLLDAIRCLQTWTPEMVGETLAWINSTDGAPIYSFTSICETLGINAALTRRILVDGAHTPTTLKCSSGRPAQLRVSRKTRRVSIN